MTNKQGLVFYPASHRYKLDGEWVPGVTTLLKDAIPSPALVKWAANSVAQYVADNPDQVDMLRGMGSRPMVNALKEVPWQARDEAANRGTEVHGYAERIVKGEEVDVPEALVGHVESCIAFLEDWGIEPVLVETPVASRQHQYAGTLDLVANHNRGPRAIFDYKTARSGIFFETSFQLVAYGMAEFLLDYDGLETPMADVGIKESYGVHIRADGYDVYPLAYGPDIYDEFVALLASARIIKRARGDWKVPGSGYVGVALQPQEATA